MGLSFDAYFMTITLTMMPKMISDMNGLFDILTSQKLIHSGSDTAQAPHA